jgi:hypothetical protein
VFALVLAMLACRQSNARSAAPAARKEAMSAELESESIDDRRVAVAKILEARTQQNQQIADLLAKYLADPSREGTAKDLIVLLGKLRAVEQLPILVRSLTFKVFYRNTKRPQTIEDLYPAVQALTDLGAPAIDPVLERIMREDQEDVARTGAAVLRNVLGLSRAVLILDQAIQTAPSDEARDRLRRAERLMRELP